jgi:zinc-ribbon domain
MMIRRLITLIPILGAILIVTSMARAQEPAGDLETLQVSFWPDFDRPSVLVLMDGQLPEGAALPAEVSIPLPSEAQLNAVATIVDAGMLTIEYQEAGGNVTFLTPQRQFRVEYYAPYEQDGRSRSFDFNWLSDSSVAEFAVQIQQPANASSLTSDPEPSEVSTNQVDGLVYHNLAPRSVAAGTPYNLAFSYVANSDGLTVAVDPAASLPDAGAQTAASVEGNNDWMLVAGALGLIVLAVAGTWFVATRRGDRKSTRPRKPSPQGRKSQAQVFCHACGKQAEQGDQFCRQCGTKLKQF